MTAPPNTAGEAAYELADDGTFTIRDYNRAKPFSSFLPGIAGLWGIPLWLFYVNRGQAVACFGTQDKDHAFAHFESANQHWRRVALEGFRTLIRLRRGGVERFYEPFRTEQAHQHVRNEMRITPGGLALSETNTTLALRIDVEYFTVPNEPFAALARSVTVHNLADTPAELDVLDGIVKVVPYGEVALFLQAMPFITESYLQVQNLAGGMPFLNLKAKPSDTPETEFVTAGNFFFGFEDGHDTLLPAIVDPELIFGDQADVVRPRALLAGSPFDPTRPQAQHCITPCAFVHWPVGLGGRQGRTLRSLYGSARSLDRARSIPATAMQAGYFARKAAENDLELARVRDRFVTVSGSRELDLYLPQTFLDNALRGGLPITLPAGGRNLIFHVYSRKHGDLERDYNFFHVAPTFYSQGNGNFRDVNQNRRNDVWFNPDVGADNVRYFFNLLQPDGFNPLVCLGAKFHVAEPDALVGLLERMVPSPRRQELAAFLRNAFSPGELFVFLDDAEIALSAGREEFLQQLLALCEKVEDAEHGGGYWTDHWFYNFDLLESFLAIFPEALGELLVERRDLTYWDDCVAVRPRDEKHVLVGPDKVRQVDSLVRDEPKARLIASRADRPNRVRLDAGRGEIYRTNLLEKIVCLLANKIASISPSGVGLDMEAGRPGWHDSVNGLPGMFGATTSEVFQLLRAIRWLRESLDRLALCDDHAQDVPVEIASLLAGVTGALRRYLDRADEGRDHAYWDETAAAKETFRREVRFGFDGAMGRVTAGDVRDLLDLAERRILASLPKALDERWGLYSTYVTHEAVEYELIETTDAAGRPAVKRSGRGLPCVRVKRFALHRYPLFLEGPMHAMRIETDAARARESHAALRGSPLHDQPLGMYILGDSIAAESQDTGRISAWPPGWFENENVFTHCEHKYLLSLLRAGLHEELFADLRACMVPFQRPEVYGRSPLENTSFIVSTRHPRPAYHGRGFLPRASGMTAEVLEIFLTLSFGRRPFRLVGGELTFRLEPVLPGWMFTDGPRRRRVVPWRGEPREMTFPANSYSALLLGRTMVTYLNDERRPTFGSAAASVKAYRLIREAAAATTVEGGEVRGPLARDIREGKYSRIEVELEWPTRP